MAKSLDGNLIKKAHAPQRYTLEEVKHLEACMDPVTGPIYFAKNFLKIQHPTRGSIPFEPYEYQERLESRLRNLIKQIIDAGVSPGVEQLVGEIANKSEMRSYKIKRRLM